MPQRMEPLSLNSHDSSGLNGGINITSLLFKFWLFHGWLMFSQTVNPYYETKLQHEALFFCVWDPWMCYRDWHLSTMEYFQEIWGWWAVINWQNSICIRMNVAAGKIHFIRCSDEKRLHSRGQMRWKHLGIRLAPIVYISEGCDHWFNVSHRQLFSGLK